MRSYYLFQGCWNRQSRIGVSYGAMVEQVVAINLYAWDDWSKATFPTKDRAGSYTFVSSMIYGCCGFFA